MTKPLELIVAATQDGGIGLSSSNTLPWPKLPRDLRGFRQTTTRATPGCRNAVIMGRRTWESLPAGTAPLSNRLTVVISSGLSWLDCSETIVLPSLSDALAELDADATVDRIFVAGGGQIYAEALRLCEAEGRKHVVHLTLVLSDFPADVHIGLDAARYVTESRSLDFEESGVRFRFEKWVPRGELAGVVVAQGEGVPYGSSSSSESEPESPPPAYAARPISGSSISSPHPERQYLGLIEDILRRGARRPDRTGVGTLSVFGASMRFSLRRGTVPLLTTKRVFWRGVVEELLWMIRGCTDSCALAERGVHIWDGNGSRAFLDSLGFADREEGDLGPVYGFQWRHAGAEYRTKRDDYSGEGVDQLADLVARIRSSPHDRRLLLCAWNPPDLCRMALPPCHVLAQFYVCDGELSCQMYQRSADVGLGVPFNIASYALLTHMVAHVTGLKAGELVHVIGDAHIYLNHVDALREQLQREPMPFPTLRLADEVTEIDDFVPEAISLEGYRCHGPIAMPMAV